MSSTSLDHELVAALKRLRLGRIATTLAERLVLAEKQTMGYEDFLLLLLTDEIARREASATDNRVREAALDPEMRLELWDKTAKVSFDKRLLGALTSLRFLEEHKHVVVLGSVGVGKTFLATALGHAAIRRRRSVHFERCDRLLKRLRASRLDNSHEVEIRKLLRVDLLIIDDFALQPLDPLDTADIYELIVERHRTASTVITSNREPVEWLGLMADPLLAQSAIDRLQSAAHELVLDGESYRQRQKPTTSDPGVDDPPARPRSSRRRT